MIFQMNLTDPFLFADDTSLFKSITNNNIQSAMQKNNSDLEKID